MKLGDKVRFFGVVLPFGLRFPPGFWPLLLAVTFVARAAYSADPAFLSRVQDRAISPNYLYNKAWRIIKDSYYDQRYNGQDWACWEHRYDGRLHTFDDAHLAIETMVASLGNPKTCFLSRDHFDEEKSQIQAHLFGVGLALHREHDKILVAGVEEGSPAANAGMRAGDAILDVNGNSVSRMTLDDVVAHIRGLINTKVTLSILRSGAEVRRVALTRAELLAHAVSAWAIQSGGSSPELGYIRIETFQPQSCVLDLRKAIAGFASSDGLVIDLRDNIGGLLTTTIDAVSLVLDKRPTNVPLTLKLKPGEPMPENPFNFPYVVSTIDADGYKQNQPSSGNAIFTKPLVILINHGTTASAEIFAAALRENGRASLVGTHSNGAPELIEAINRLEDGSGLTVSIARWRGPKGNDFSGTGISPDVLVELSAKDRAAGKGPWWSVAVGANVDAKNLKDAQLLKALEVLKKSVQDSATKKRCPNEDS